MQLLIAVVESRGPKHLNARVKVVDKPPLQQFAVLGQWREGSSDMRIHYSFCDEFDALIEVILG